MNSSKRRTIAVLTRLLSALVIVLMVAGLFVSPFLSSRADVMAQDQISTPTVEPTVEPTLPPTDPTPTEPSVIPTDQPTKLPTQEPTEIPIELPTEEFIPTEEITPTATELPEVVPLIIPDDAEVIPDQYIVVYKDGKASKDAVKKAASDAVTMGSKVDFIFASSFKGFSGKLSPQALKVLRRDPRIKFIEADQIVRLDDTVTTLQQQANAPWGLDRIDQSMLPLDTKYFSPSNGGAGVNVYVIDTGIYAAHTDFGGRVSLDYFDIIGDGYNGSDCNGHGTHVAGTIGGSVYGVAKSITLHSVRVLGCTGSGSMSGVIAGVDWVRVNHASPAVANMSLGGGVSAALDAAVESAIASGVTIAIAAGNSNADACNASPARTPSAITVAASDSSDRRASFSNYGSCVDIFAPGVAILSDYKTSSTATATMSGTSMSSPHVAGAAALYLSQNPSATPAEVGIALMSRSTKDLVVDPAGSPNRLLLTNTYTFTAPVLLSPANGAVISSNPPSLTWSLSSDFAAYEVNIDDNSTFTHPSGDFVTASTYTTGNLQDGKWYWRVRGLNSSNIAGPWSEISSFTLDSTPPLKPQLSAPLNGVTVTGIPAFTWLAAASAVKYQFEFNNVADAETYLFRSGELTTLKYKPTTIPFMSILYWYVRAEDSVGNWSEWSGPYTVTVLPLKPAAPVLVSPASGFATYDTSPLLTWKTMAYASSYDLQVDDSSTFSPQPLIREYTNLADVTHELSNLPDGKYYWRVQAKNVAGVVSSWSSARVFTIDTIVPASPKLSTPTEGSTTPGIPKFTWLASTSAVRYQFAFNTVNDPETALFKTGEISTLAYKPGAMPLKTALYWFVRAKDAAGNWSGWSTPLSVTVSPLKPLAPILISPSSGATVNTYTPTLTWKPVLYGHTYEVQVDNTSGFTSVNFSSISAENITSMAVDSLPGGTWYWRVRAINIDGVASGWSSARYFKIPLGFNSQFDTNGVFEGWKQRPGATWSLADGALKNPGLTTDATSSASYGDTIFSDFTYEAKVKMDLNASDPDASFSGSYGLIARGTPTFDGSNDWKNGYYFAVGQVKYSAYGNYACFNVWQITNGAWASQTDGSKWWCSKTINYGDWNTLKVYAKGTTMNFYINDTLVWSGEVSGALKGNLGVYSYSVTGNAKTASVDWARGGLPVLPTAALQATDLTTLPEEVTLSR